MSIFVLKNKDNKVKFVRKVVGSDGVKVYKNGYVKAKFTNSETTKIYSNNTIMDPDQSGYYMRVDENGHWHYLDQVFLPNVDLTKQEYVDSTTGEPHYTFERYNFIFSTYQSQQLKDYYNQYLAESAAASLTPFPYEEFLGLSMFVQGMSMAEQNAQTVGSLPYLKPWIIYNKNGTEYVKVIIKYIIPDIYLSDLWNKQLPQDRSHPIVSLEKLYDKEYTKSDFSSQFNASNLVLLYPTEELWSEIWSMLDLNKKIEYVQSNSQLDKGGTLMLVIIDD